MAMDLSSVNNSISNFFNTYGASSNKSANDQIKNRVNNLVLNRSSLVDYIKSDNSDSFNLSSNNDSNSLLSALSSMKSTSGMSSIEKYKYMMEQAQNLNLEKIDTAEPDAEKLLSKSEKIIQRTLSEGISAEDVINLNRALTAKQIALSRLDMLG